MTQKEFVYLMKQAEMFNKKAVLVLKHNFIKENVYIIISENYKQRAKSILSKHFPMIDENLKIEGGFLVDKNFVLL